MKLNWRGKSWEWNNFDRELLRVNNWTDDLNAALKLLSKSRRRTAIQAGGAMGLWPWEMSKQFERVYSFEAHPDNFRCLQENMKGLTNVHIMNAGLGKEKGFCEVKLPEDEENNAGAFYTMPADEGIPQIVLDDLDIEGVVDLIQLDIEGRELEVLQGAKNIIEKFSPIIMVEDKELPQDEEINHVVGDIEEYLTELGYEVVNKVHKDIIFSRGTNT